MAVATTSFLSLYKFIFNIGRQKKTITKNNVIFAICFNFFNFPTHKNLFNYTTHKNASDDMRIYRLWLHIAQQLHTLLCECVPMPETTVL